MVNFESFSWTGVDTESNGRRLLVRFVTLPKRFPKSKYPVRINLFWTMSETYEDGLATPEELNKQHVFENHLCEAVHPDQHSILVLAFTSNGEKEFVFHTGDVDGFIQRLTNMPQDSERYPITIQRNDDPDWEYFKSITSNYR
jgi:hypothetical protein